MKKFACLLVIFSLAACKKDPRVPEQPSQIDGLELTFIDTRQLFFNPVICFTSESEGYAANYDGRIMKTTDGGYHWQNQNSTTSLPLYDIFFLDSDEGFAVGGKSFCGGPGCVPEGAVMLHTKNGGQTWEQVPLNTKNKIELQSVHFADRLNGYAVGINSILSSKNGGLTWKENIITDLGATCLDVKFASANKGLVTCGFGKILKTTDGGTTWQISKPFSAGGWPRLDAVNEDLIFVIGTGLFKTTDFADTWTPVSNFPIGVSQVVFKTKDFGYIFGTGEYSGGDFGTYKGAIYYTLDGGKTWTGSNKIHETNVFTSTSFPNNETGYAMSNNILVKIKKL
ncbi:MAG TPA: hypothetical protein PL029_07310 [Bacteroidia bacterium]|nr:hypothetical protein [Bacteroidia bacterium]